MAQVRNISGEPRQVPELGGFGGGRTVDVDETVDVPDDRYAGYVAQEGTWEGVTEPVGDVVDPTINPAPADDDETFVADDEDVDGAPVERLPLYLHAGADQNDIDLEVWPLADVETTDGALLFHHVGDTAGGEPTAADDTWHVYSGPTKAAHEGSES